MWRIKVNSSKWRIFHFRLSYVPWPKWSVHIFYGCYWDCFTVCIFHYYDVIMGAMASQITSLTIVYSTVYSHADQSKHQSSTSLAFVRGFNRGPVNSPHKWPVTRKMFPFDDVIMLDIVLPEMLDYSGVTANIVADSERRNRISSVCSTVGSGVDQRKHSSSASLAFVRGIHRWSVNSRR